MPSLINGRLMFSCCYGLKTFKSNMPTLIFGEGLLSGNSELVSFSGDLNSLIDGCGMFEDCPKLTTFTSNLDNMMVGLGMFGSCKLNPTSMMYILGSIQNINELKSKYQSGEIEWVTYDAESETYSKPFGFM